MDESGNLFWRCEAVKQLQEMATGGIEVDNVCNTQI